MSPNRFRLLLIFCIGLFDVLTKLSGIGHEIEIHDDEAQSKNGFHPEEESSHGIGLASEVAEDPSRVKVEELS